MGRLHSGERARVRRRRARVELTKEEKRKKALKGVAIAGVVVLCFGALFGIFALSNLTGTKALMKLGNNFDAVAYAEGEQLVPVRDTDGYWTFTTDRDLKIVQFTDVHIGAGFGSRRKDAWAMNAVAAMIAVEKPDLVIVTGDIAYPVPFQAGTFNNLNAAKVFANMMENLGVYWTFTFGNHDTESYSYYTRSDICEYYEGQNFKYCLFDRGSSNVDGEGNSIIKVKNSDGLVTQALVTLDSHSYTDGDALGMYWKYDNLHQNQVDWYAAEIGKLNEANNAIAGTDSYPVKSLAFFHIPLREYRTAFAEYVKNGYEDTEDVKLIYGIMGESMNENSEGEQTYGVYCGMGEDNFFEVGRDNGLQGIFCGHDHYNNFSIDYMGVRLTYSYSIDYLAYMGIHKERAQRGCTLITVSPDGSFECELSNYYSGKYNHNDKTKA